jgi:hypothetical protein
VLGCLIRLFFFFASFVLGLGDVEVPAFTAAIEAHQRRITQAIMDHALSICDGKGVTEILI